MATRGHCRDRAVLAAVPFRPAPNSRFAHPRPRPRRAVPDRHRGRGHASGSLGQSHPSHGDRGDGSFELIDVAPGAYVVKVEVGGTVAVTRALVVRGSLPVELTLQYRTLGRRVRRGSRRRRFNHRRTSVDARGRGSPKRPRADPEPARPGRAGQPPWLDVRGQRPAARARRGRRVALRAGRDSGVRTAGLAVRDASEPRPASRRSTSSTATSRRSSGSRAAASSRSGRKPGSATRGRERSTPASQTWARGTWRASPPGRSAAAPA